jgi:hypothetical protein
MEAGELLEVGKESTETSERLVGLTMAVVAALLAASTLMGHRLHTEETVAQTKSADGWAFFQAKNSRSQMYAADATLAELIGPQGAAVAADWKKKAVAERQEADEVRRNNEELDKVTEATARRATVFDIAEICLEIAIVLCSITLLAKTKMFWRLSFLPTAIGAVMAVYGLLRS